MKLFLFAVGAKDRASSRLRVWDHVAWLRGEGHEVRVASLMGEGVKRADLASYARIALRAPGWVWNFLWADAVVVQESLLLWPAALLKNLGKRRRLVFDFSDPVDRIGAGLKRRLRQKAFDIFIRRADAVIVENRSYVGLLGGAARDVSYFYGPVDARRYAASREALGGHRPASLRIGWTGSPGTYKFIAPLMPIIDELARDREIEVMLIGMRTIDYQFRFARLTLVDWDESTEFALLPSFDLGLFRLDEGDDALWRGAGKLFIYMAAGVCFIATDRGIAQALMQEAGVGFAVPHEDDWLSVLRSAALSEETRRNMAEKCVTFARDQLSYEVYRRKLLSHLSAGARKVSDR